MAFQVHHTRIGVRLGHDRAGFRGLESLTSNIHIAALHIFDPNVGEYVGTLQELDGVLRHLLQQVPAYALVSDVSRSRDA